MRNNFSLALLDSLQLSRRDYSVCLTEREREQFRKPKHARRAQEWLAGRLAAKSIFLKTQATSTGFLRLTEPTLHEFAPSEYRCVEVTRSDEIRSGRPQVGFAGEAPRDVAITHTNGSACALLGEGDFAADLEQVKARSESFYRGNFTSEERRWAVRGGALLNFHWALTLLWSIKECLLKMPQFANLSVWNMPSMSVTIPQLGDGLAAISTNGALERCLFLPAEIREGKRTVHAQMAVSGNPALVLCAMQAVKIIE